MSNKAEITHFDPEWTNIYKAESLKVTEALRLRSLHHIGSTAIHGIYAKPIIDMLGEVDDIEKVDALNPRIEKIGYESLGEFGIAGRRYFRKDVDGVRKFHLHVFEKESDEALRHLRFRDFMNAHPEWARKYSDLKRELARVCEGDMDKYIDGKHGFIKNIHRLSLSFYSSES
jgi:GrpB-like predicted nucleotidyltransferase (UPF0157 family)